jgi:UDP-N-acetylglucosamine/UDP-N-acetylgalactosamine 4-epimerase
MKVLITGGAGFIGSNLVKHFLENKVFSQVVVLDNLETGHLKNIQKYLEYPNFTFIQGDIRNSEDCLKACEGVDVITHQAALGSVPRSIKDPITSHQVNVNGFLNVLEAARSHQIKRVVYASSSSVYGDLAESPKVESRVGKLLSPYAATKMSNELYAEAYAKNYGITLIGLRYFNVFGPNQDPFGPYAAVIPLFIKAALSGQSPLINGDGSITRDFTPVKNVIQINQKALLNELKESSHYVFNVACGQTTNLNMIWEMIQDIVGVKLQATHGPNRPGDILYSLADIQHASKVLGYNPESNLKSFLEETIKYYKAII